jgi:glycosyltransferase involved in cell wall biosynthesis
MASALPKISVVTATLNRAGFLEDTIRSVLDQDYPNLEYVIIDGGSTDGSFDIIRKYESRLAYWVSEKDAGHFDALQKGFARTSGDVMAFINSDDKFCPWAFSVVGEIFAKFPQIEWLTTLFPIIWDAKGRATHCRSTEGFSKQGFFRGQYLPGNNGAYATHWIQQESTFWRRSLWEKAGGKVDIGMRVGGDFELWARFFEHADLYAVSTPLGGFRIHGDQFTALQLEKYMKVCTDVLAKHGGKPHGAPTTALAKGRLGRYLPKKARRLLGLDHPKKIVVHQGGGVGWTIKET